MSSDAGQSHQGPDLEYAGETPPSEREELDGCGAGSELDELETTSDADIAGVVLYADVDPTDPAAIELRRSEWAELLS
jgi:hypothetical protein